MTDVKECSAQITCVGEKGCFAELSCKSPASEIGDESKMQFVILDLVSER